MEKRRTRCWHLVQLLGLVLIRCSTALSIGSSTLIRTGSASNGTMAVEFVPIMISENIASCNATGGNCTYTTVNTTATKYMYKKQPTLRIGAPLTLTNGLGRLSDLGRELSQGYNFLVSWVNDQGGVNISGVYHNVEMSLIDDMGDWKQAAKIASGLIRSQGVKLLLGPGGDNLTNAVAQVVNDTGAVLLAPSAVEDYVFERNPGVFGTFRPPNKTFEGVLNALQNLGTKPESISYIVEDVAFQRTFCNSVPGLASKFGLELKTEAVVSPGADSSSFRTALTAVADNKPNVLIGCVSENLCVRLLEVVEELKIDPAALVLLDCVSGLDPVKAIGNRAMYILGVTEWSPRLPLSDDSGTWTASSITHEYAVRYGRARPSLDAISGMTAAEALLRAIEAAGTIDPIAVRAKLNSVDRNSAFGRVKFDETGRIISDTFVLQTGPWNSTRIVLPEASAKAGIVFPFPQWEDEPCLRTLSWSRYGYNEEGKCEPCPVVHKSIIVNGTVPSLKTFAAAKTEVYRTCESCPLFHASIDKGGCLKCPFGHLVDATGKECHACPPGRYRNPGGKDPDTDEPYAPGDSCTACPPGKFQSKEGQESCVPCGLGTANEYFGRAECQRCGPLARQPVLDPAIIKARNFSHFCRWSSRATRFTTACMVCEDGPEGPKQATMCCDMGSARMDMKLTGDFNFDVQVCVAGDTAHVPEQFCEHLPRPESCGSYKYSPPEDLEDPDLTYYTDDIGQIECKKCPQGAVCVSSCPNGDGNCTAHEVVRTRYIAGYDHYAMRHPAAMKLNPKHGIGPFECRTPGACIGSYINGTNKCHENMEGLMCNNCKPGYTRHWESDICWQCPSHADSVNYSFLGICAVAFHIVVLGYLAQRAGRRPRALQSIILMIFSNHLQTIAIAYSFCRPGLQGVIGEYLAYWFQFADILSQDPARGGGLFDCVLYYNQYNSILEFADQPEGFPGRYGITFGALIIIPIVVLMVVVCYTVVFLFPRLHLTKKSVWPHQRALLLERRGYGPWVLVAIIVVHPIATKFLLQPFDCAMQNAGTSRMYDVERFVPKMEVACGSDEHVQAQLLGAVGLLVWSFGLPLAFYLILRPIRKKRKLREAWCFESLGFLYNGFEPEYYYWFSINMVRKVLFCICAAVPGYSDSGRATIMLFVAMVMFTLSNAYRPYDNRAYDILDTLERISIRSMIYMLLARLTQVVTDNSYRFNDPQSREIRDHILMAMVCFMQLHVVWLTFWGLFREWLKPQLEKCMLMQAPEKVTLSNKSAQPRDAAQPAEKKLFAAFRDQQAKVPWMPNGGGCVLDAKGQAASGFLHRMAAMEKEAVKKAKRMSHEREMKKKGEVPPEEEPEEEEEEPHDGVGDRDQELLGHIYREIFTLILRKTHVVDLHDVRMVLRGAMSVATVNSGILTKEQKKDLVDEDGLPIKPLLSPVTAEQLHVGLTQLTLKLSGEDWDSLQRFDDEAEEFGFPEKHHKHHGGAPKKKKGGCCGGGGAEEDEDDDGPSLIAELEYNPEGPPQAPEVDAAPPPLWPHPEDTPKLFPPEPLYPDNTQDIEEGMKGARLSLDDMPPPPLLGDSLEAEVAAWVEAVSGDKRQGSFAEWLKDGQVLCKVINHIQPGIVHKVHTENMPFKQMENVSNFIGACRKLGVLEKDVFDLFDLYEEKNLKAVCLCIYNLGSVIRNTAPGFHGPYLGVDPEMPPPPLPGSMEEPPPKPKAKKKRHFGEKDNINFEASRIAVKQ